MLGLIRGRPLARWCSACKTAPDNSGLREAHLFPKKGLKKDVAISNELGENLRLALCRRSGKNAAKACYREEPEMPRLKMTRTRFAAGLVAARLESTTALTRERPNPGTLWLTAR